MSSSSQPWELRSAIPPIRPDQVNWYALQTRARHEKSVAERLQEQNLITFLPLVREVHRWSDRRKVVELPLFMGVRGQGVPIPDEQIEAIRTLVAQQLPWSVHPFLKVGQRVRIRGGSLDAVEGILLSRNGDRTLVVSVDAIQRSLAVHIEGYDVEPI